MPTAAFSTTILLIRHGQSEHNVSLRFAGWSDSPLTDLGREQARLMAAYVSCAYQVDALYASPLRRALDTARELAERIDRQPVLDDDLREINFGAVEGLTDREFLARFPVEYQTARGWETLEFTWPDGENRLEFHERVQRHLQRLLSQHQGQTVAIVSHGGLIGGAIASLLGENPISWRNYLPDNCAVSRLVIKPGHVTLAEFNLTSYLADRAIPRVDP